MSQNNHPFLLRKESPWKRSIYAKGTLLTDKIMETAMQEFTPTNRRKMNWQTILQHVQPKSHQYVKRAILAQYISLFEYDDYPVMFQAGKLAFYPRNYAPTLLQTFNLQYVTRSLPLDQQRQFLVDSGMTLAEAKNKYDHVFNGQETITLSLSDEEESSMIDVEF